MTKFYWLYGVYFLFVVVASAQTANTATTLVFQLRFNNQPFLINQRYASKNDSLTISAFKTYISGITLVDEEQNLHNEKNSYHLIDAANTETWQIPTGISTTHKVKAVRFYIGVDSLASTSGALEGDLDPSNGMYWAWHSGYINTKIEGNSNSCPSRNHQFQFHIGGYAKPNYALRSIEIPVVPSNNQNEIPIGIDLAAFFNSIHLKDTHTVMTPGQKAMALADTSTLLFREK